MSLAETGGVGESIRWWEAHLRTESHQGGAEQGHVNDKEEQNALHFLKAAQPGTLEMFIVSIHFQQPQINNIGTHTDA